MTLEIKRLHLASLQGLDGGTWPVHGFVVTHPGGAVLVDTGVGGPQDVLDDWRVVNRSVADALAELDMSPADIGLVINTHLHFDHCGQNAVFKHAPFYVQRAELDRMRREAGELYDWFGFMDARFELLDGDAEVLPGLEVITTPGHTSGHQCVVVRGDSGRHSTCSSATRPTRPGSTPTRWARSRTARPATSRPGAIRSTGSARWPRSGCISATTPTSCTADWRLSCRSSRKPGAYRPPSGGEPNDWIVHLTTGDLSLGTYSIPAGGVDDQQPHTEDEIYVVTDGPGHAGYGVGHRCRWGRAA